MSDEKTEWKVGMWVAVLDDGKPIAATKIVDIALQTRGKRKGTVKTFATFGGGRWTASGHGDYFQSSRRVVPLIQAHREPIRRYRLIKRLTALTAKELEGLSTANLEALIAIVGEKPAEG